MLRRKKKSKTYTKEEVISIISKIKELVASKEYSLKEIEEGLIQCEEFLKNPS